MDLLILAGLIYGVWCLKIVARAGSTAPAGRLTTFGE